jgi:hypothetical protein
MPHLITQRVTTERTHHITLDDEFLRVAINQELKAQGEEPMAENARMYVSVPGGGDWSNTELELSDAPLNIQWTTVDRSE